MILHYFLNASGQAPTFSSSSSRAPYSHRQQLYYDTSAFDDYSNQYDYSATASGAPYSASSYGQPFYHDPRGHAAYNTTASAAAASSGRQPYHVHAAYSATASAATTSGLNPHAKPFHSSAVTQADKPNCHTHLKVQLEWMDETGATQTKDVFVKFEDLARCPDNLLYKMIENDLSGDNTNDSQEYLVVPLKVKITPEIFQAIVGYLKNGSLDFYRFHPEMHNQLIAASHYLALNDLYKSLTTFFIRDIERIGYLTNLHSLKLEELSHDHIQTLAPLLQKLPTLWHIDLQGDFNDKDVAPFIKALPNPQNLVTFAIDNDNIGNNEVQILTQALQNARALSSLSIKGRFGIGGVYSISNTAKRMPNLTALEIKGNFKDDATHSIADALRYMPHLTTLLVNGRLSDEGAQILAKQLRHMKNLISLSISIWEYGSVKDISSWDLAEALQHMPNLKSFAVNNIYESEECLAQTLKRMTQLESLSITGNVINLDTILPNLCRLKSLSVYNYKDAEALAKALPHTLTSLRGSFNDEGIKHIARTLPNMPNLTLLELDGITNEGITHIAEAMLHAPNLTSLSLKGSFNDIGIGHLIYELPHKQKLKAFSLWGEFSDHGAQYLASVFPSMKTLIDLEIKGNIRNLGVQSLTSTVSSMPKLSSLMITGKFNHIGAQYIANILPVMMYQLSSLTLNGSFTRSMSSTGQSRDDYQTVNQMFERYKPFLSITFEPKTKLTLSH